MSGLPSVSVVIPTHNRKEKLIRLINSILQSNYPKDKIEIIVVDDASTDETYRDVKRLFPQVRIIRSEKRLFAAGARNRGIKLAKGEYLFLIDDDNIVDRDCIRNLVEFLKNHKDIGAVAPLILYYGTTTIQTAGARRSMITSRTIHLLNGRDLQNTNIPKIIEIDDAGYLMVRQEVIKKYNILFNEKDFPIHYGESDFCYRIRNVGYKIVCYTPAIVWHDARKGRTAGLETEWRTYFTARNRIIFHKKYSKWWQFLIFILIFSWLFTLYYLTVILVESKKTFKERLRIAKAYFKGFIDGLKLCVL